MKKLDLSKNNKVEKSDQEEKVSSKLNGHFMLVNKRDVCSSHSSAVADNRNYITNYIVTKRTFEK